MSFCWLFGHELVGSYLRYANSGHIRTIFSCSKCGYEEYAPQLAIPEKVKQRVKPL